MTEPSSLVELIAPRATTLGGADGTQVRRTLPTRRRSMIGGWCFLDHFGPSDVAVTGGMQVAPHPHTGLQTVSWLFDGEVEHRDSAGNHAFIRPGEVNLMTAGHGISHSEVSTDHAQTLRGMQLWVALPDSARSIAPGFDHYVPEIGSDDGVTSRVFLGSLLGSHSPVATHSALLGAELTLAGGSTIDLAIDPRFEHGVIVDRGDVRIHDHDVPTDHLAYLPTGSTRLRLEALSPTRILLLGGEPLGEPIVMWWNFIGRTHEDIAEARAQWQAEVTRSAASTRFGMPVSDAQAPLGAPDLPGLRLKPRT